MLIDATIFIGEISIAQRSQPEVAVNINAFIAKYEPKFLNLLLGSEFNVLFQAGLLADPIAARWAALSTTTELKQAIANYVYYWYMRNQASQTVGMGEAKPKAENATVISSNAKTVRAWNEMVDYCREFTLDADLYPEWESTWVRRYFGYYPYGYYSYPEIYDKINTLNI